MHRDRTKPLAAAEIGISPVSGLGAFAVLAPIGLDDWSDVRHLHVQAFDKLVAANLDNSEAQAYKAVLTSFEYGEALQDANLVGAWIDGHLVGTCNWRPADDAGASARIGGLFVDPLFARIGLGRRLVQETEASARAAGFRVLAVHAPANAIGFFAGVGYTVASHGIHAIDSSIGFPVAFMRKVCPRDDGKGD